MINTNISGATGSGVHNFAAMRAIQTGKPIMVVTFHPELRKQWSDQIPGASCISIMQLLTNGGVAPWATEYLLILDLNPSWWRCARDFLHSLPEECWAINGPDDICIPPKKEPQ